MGEGEAGCACALRKGPGGKDGWGWGVGTEASEEGRTDALEGTFMGNHILGAGSVASHVGISGVLSRMYTINWWKLRS